MYSIAQKTFKK